MDVQIRGPYRLRGHGHQVAAVLARHPGLRVETLAPIGEDPRFAALLRTIAAAAGG